MNFNQYRIREENEELKYTVNNKSMDRSRKLVKNTTPNEKVREKSKTKEKEILKSLDIRNFRMKI